MDTHLDVSNFFQNVDEEIYIFTKGENEMKHLVDLYQALLKHKEKKIETNFVCDDNFDLSQIDVTHLDVVDFFIEENKSLD